MTGWAHRHARALVAFAVCAPLLTATAVAATAPAAPTGLTAASPTRLAPALTWNPAAGASNGYRVYRGKTQVGGRRRRTSPAAATATRSSRSQTATSFRPHLPPVTVVYDILAPKAVTAISAVTPTALAPSLSWTAATDTGGSGLKRYEVFRDGASLGFTSTPSFVDTGAPDGSHSYTVVSEDGAGDRSAPSPAKLVLIDSTPPSTPAAPQAAQTDTASAPALSWTAATDAGTGVSGYRILRNGSQVGTSTTTSFTDSGLAASGSYDYTIVAYDALGNASPAFAAPPPSPTTRRLRQRPPA